VKKLKFAKYRKAKLTGMRKRAENLSIYAFFRGKMSMGEK
jgi:hypothetical protein